MNLTIIKQIFWAGLLMCMCSSCASVFWQPMQHKEARYGSTPPGGSVLDSLPEPKEPLIVAVYQFRDQTGQYKPAEGGSSFSTAVTQGAATILVKVLADSKWFAPIERENIGNLLNERKIVRSTRQQYGLNEELPALLYAGVMLEGGIVSYDANVITGGAGLRYFGSGASSQYRQDRVTVYLRAISTSNGKILKTVYATKTVLSQAMDGGLFRYVAFRRLLEAETGFTYNEPSEMAITEAIEKAVQSLIIEGIEDSLWELKDPSKKKSVMDAYKAENDENQQTDVIGQVNQPRRRSVDLGLGMHSLWYRGDFARGRITPGFAAALNYNFRPRSAIGAKAYLGSFRTAGNYRSGVTGVDVLFTHRYSPWYRVSPYLQAGLGVISTQNTTAPQPLAVGGIGLEYLAKPQIGLRLFSDCHYGFTDRWDGARRGVSPDFAYTIQAGVHFYFGRAIKSDMKSKTTKKADKREPLKDF